MRYCLCLAFAVMFKYPCIVFIFRKQGRHGEVRKRIFGWGIHTTSSKGNRCARKISRWTRITSGITITAAAINTTNPSPTKARYIYIHYEKNYCSHRQVCINVPVCVYVHYADSNTEGTPVRYKQRIDSLPFTIAKPGCKFVAFMNGLQLALRCPPHKGQHTGSLPHKGHRSPPCKGGLQGTQNTRIRWKGGGMASWPKSVHKLYSL